MNRHIFFYLLATGLAGILLPAGITSCSSETGDTSEGSDLWPVSVAISLSSESQNDDKINTLDIYIMDADRKVEAHVDENKFTFTNGSPNKGETTSTIELKPGPKTVYAFANCKGDAFSGLGLENEWKTVPNIVAGNGALNVLPQQISADNGIPMSARITTWNVTQSQATYPVELIRMVAQMSVTIKDQRADKSNSITSLTIAGLLPDKTNLFRKEKDLVELPQGVNMSDWSVTSPTAENITPFYLHETNVASTVTMKIKNEETSRTATFNKLIPRNSKFPLIIHITDYSLAISGTYELEAIGTITASKNIGNGYTIELPEGASNIDIAVQLKSGGTAQTTGVTWTTDPSDPPAYFTFDTSGADATFVITSDAIPTLATVEQNFKLSATFKEDGADKTVDFDLTIKVRPLKDGDLNTKVADTQTIPIIIEL